MRRAGLLLPLSALRSREDLGIGDTAALEPFFDWMRSAGFSVLQILPLNDLAPGDSCPYTAISAFALDPAYISLSRVPEIRNSPALRRELRRTLESAQARRLTRSKRVRFGAVRKLKSRFLEDAFRAFERREVPRRSQRAAAFTAFVRSERPWLMDYTLFRALKEETSWRSWKRWPAPLRERREGALGEARRRLAGRTRFHQYVQWLIAEQWAEARQRAKARGVRLLGDIPFGLSRESADVWARAREFDFSVSMGAPPDQYSATGQAWGLPAYRWKAMEAGGHVWWRLRLRQTRKLYDMFRIDHAVGFFRTWLIRPGRRKNGFDIERTQDQRARGRRFFRMVLQEGYPAGVVAEDLGLIPDFVREVLTDLGIPGTKVPRWERDNGGFAHTRSFPSLSVATTGNHDTSTLASWWGGLRSAEREAYWRMVTGGDGRAPRPQHRSRGGRARRPGTGASVAGVDAAPRFSAGVHRRLLANLYEAGSSLVLLPFQDVFGTRERINVPATVSDRNWTYRIPWDAEDLLRDPRLRRQTAFVRDLAKRAKRC